ncbi:hypothetical protein N7G274_004544 [Stereocaulon virgatum]|uniref:Uncharacterized protein n=1 Tax=Stereocaulon virgatum TaxID=373712 RepID=A0ABR4AAI9_9LECA
MAMGKCLADHTSRLAKNNTATIVTLDAMLNMLCIGFSSNTYVRTVHPFVIIQLISVLGVSELFSLRVTFTPQGIDLLGIGKFSVDPSKPLGSLANALSDDAKVTLLDIAIILSR